MLAVALSLALLAGAADASPTFRPEDAPAADRATSFAEGDLRGLSRAGARR